MSKNKPIICPTVTASEPHEYRAQMERIAKFAHRVHIDLADGVFTDNKLIELSHVWWPAGMTADIHLMYESAKPFLKQLVDLHPHMVIIQAESVGNFYDISKVLNKHGIRVGVALLQHTKPEKIKSAIKDISHILIFSGHLGYYGGQADLGLLDKVKKIKKWNPKIEFGWDGGINTENAKALTEGGIDILNVGGGIQRAQNPEAAYDKLIGIIGG